MLLYVEPSTSFSPFPNCTASVTVYFSLSWNITETHPSLFLSASGQFANAPKWFLVVSRKNKSALSGTQGRLPHAAFNKSIFSPSYSPLSVVLPLPLCCFNQLQPPQTLVLGMSSLRFDSKEIWSLWSRSDFCKMDKTNLTSLRVEPRGLPMWLKAQCKDT